MKKCYEHMTKEQLIEILVGKEKKLPTKDYGLVWEYNFGNDEFVGLSDEKDVVLDEIVENNISTNQRREKTLVEGSNCNSKKVFNDGDLSHILIEGDNYTALSILNNEYENKIDFIYIDPPYNTGTKTGFNYNDCRIDRTNLYSHSQWLNFMSVRLSLAKNLLKDSGLIFISIGEKELSHLDLLCKKIFGENNFLTIISRISKTASDKGCYFAPSCDYVVCYAKNKSLLNPCDFFDDVDETLYKKEDEQGLYRDDIAFYQASLDPLRGCINQRYYIECPDGSYVIPPGFAMPDTIEDAAVVKPLTKQDKVWRWSYETYLKQKHLLVFKETKTSPLVDENGNKAKYNVYTKSYLKDRSQKGVKPRNFLIDKQFLNRRGTDYLKNMGLNFSYSKPKELIIYLMSLIHLPKDAIVLDFFAGSGTTGEAVLELNKKNNANRKFILCTNNEDNICSNICYPRLKKVMEGYQQINDGKVVEGFGGNLKYYRVNSKC